MASLLLRSIFPCPSSVVSRCGSRPIGFETSSLFHPVEAMRKRRRFDKMEYSPLMCQSVFRVLLCIVVLASFGCRRAAQVSLKTELKEIHKDRMVFEVVGPPSSEIGLGREALHAETTDATGLATLSFTNQELGERDNPQVYAYKDSMFGRKSLLGTGFLVPPVNPGSILYHAKKNPEAKVLLVTPGDGQVPDTCFSLKSKTFGDGTVHATQGGLFIGPKGTKVDLGGESFMIGDSGFTNWKPSSEFLMRHFHELTVVRIEVKADEDPVERAKATFKRGTCREQLSAYIRERVVAEDPLIEGMELEGWGYLLVRATHKFEHHSLQGLEGVYAQAPFIAIEHETAKRQAGQCTRANVKYVDKDLTAWGNYDKKDRFIIDTRVDLFNAASHKKIASKSFVAKPSSECVVLPASREIEKWISGYIPEHPRMKKKRGKR